MSASLQCFRRFALAAALILGFGRPAGAWGREGHRAVGIIAQQRLSDSARKGCRRLLGPMFSLAEVSTWADEIKRERGFTRPWHYVNIPISRDKYVPRVDCPDGNCIVARLPEFIRQINDPRLSETKRKEALMFVVHLVGDLHQPLHCGDRGDRGGNDVRIANPRPAAAVNLHRVWDFGAFERAHLTAEDLAAAGRRSLAARPIYLPKRLRYRRQVRQWAMESHDLARDQAYRGVPAGRPFRLDDSYHRRVLAISGRQIGLAGARLAAILNQVFARPKRRAGKLIRDEGWGTAAPRG